MTGCAGSASTEEDAPRERDLLDQILGTKQHPYYFRYPYGAGSTAKEAVLKANNYPDGGSAGTSTRSTGALPRMAPARTPA